MVWQNTDPLAGLHEQQNVEADVTKRVDNPGVRPHSFFDGGNWTEDTRERLGVRLFARIEIPNTNKNDMRKYAELLHGLATQMDHIAANTALTEHGAYLQFRSTVDIINHELKSLGKIDLREQKNRSKLRKQVHRKDTTSS